MPGILLINSPNLNLLGTREPHLYGTTSLTDIENTAKALASSKKIHLEAFQSNHEGAIIDRIHAARGQFDAVLINAGALTHTSVAIRDALIGVSIPFIEIHITNVHTRELFRHLSYLSDKAVACIVGLGVYGYEAGVEYVARYLVKTD